MARNKKRQASKKAPEHDEDPTVQQTESGGVTDADNSNDDSAKVHSAGQEESESPLANGNPSGDKGQPKPTYSEVVQEGTADGESESKENNETNTKSRKDPNYSKHNGNALEDSSESSTEEKDDEKQAKDGIKNNEGIGSSEGNAKRGERDSAGGSCDPCGSDSKSDFTRPKSPFDKIEFAPFNVPMSRRRQTLAHVIMAILPFATQWTFLLCFLLPPLWPLLIGYLIFIRYDDTPETGGRKIEWMRRLPIWKWYTEFFPARLIAEKPLDPQGNYIFGYHPHGIISMGVFSNFATEATGVSKIFPGQNIRPLTLGPNFRIPFYREFLLAMGAASVSRKSITNIIGKGPGNSCLIVVGGAEESLEAKPDSANLVLAQRYGFVRMAIVCGADLVPVFGFGENQLYDQADNSSGTWTRSIQTHLKHLLGFTIPLFYGRGVFTYNLGILPHRLPLNVIVGQPISVQQNPDPSKEIVQAVHKQYLEALTDLYNRNKDSYWIGSNPPDLSFI